MKITNLRYGFACNSSSTHSVVVYQPNAMRQPGWKPASDYLCEEGEFGWEPFIAASKAAKLSYMKAVIAGRILGTKDPIDYDKHTMEAMIAQVTPADVHIADVPLGYIDHQSVPLIPRWYGSKVFPPEFFIDMLDYVLRDDVVILGGNDQGSGEDYQRAYLGGTESPLWYSQIPKDVSDKEWICRQEGHWWVLFNTHTGKKITLTFKDDAKPRLYANSPELVDLKITDWCPYECAFCYQGSSLQGDHAVNVDQWLLTLKFMQVFEVAIGGGEPTLHPDFERILQHSAEWYVDLKINFSTRNFKWLFEHVDLIVKNHHGFAYSVNNVGQVKNFIYEINQLSQKTRPEFFGLASIQYVMRSATDEEFVAILNLCNDEGIKLTLLGYKESGRGSSYVPPVTPIQSNVDVWAPLVKKAWWVGIDTALAKSVPEGVFDERLLRRTEGTHGMYIDAVTDQAGRDSYTDERMPVEATVESVMKAYECFHK